jgi:molybdopterin-guanine dinucleotide biosynthesis protein A
MTGPAERAADLPKKQQCVAPGGPMLEAGQPDLAAVILTGGASRRMGQSKATGMWGEVRAVDRLSNLARAIGAKAVVTAGGPDLGLPHAPDPVPLSGPVAGVRAFAALRGSGDAERWLILAVDAPTIRPEDLVPLLAMPSPGACYESLPLPMVLWASAMPADAEDGWPLWRLVERAGLARLAPNPGRLAHLRGANTPAERAALLAASGLF